MRLNSVSSLCWPARIGKSQTHYLGLDLGRWKLWGNYSLHQQLWCTQMEINMGRNQPISGRLLELEWSIWVIPPESTTGFSETVLDQTCVVVCRCVRNVSRSHLRKISRKGFRWELSANSRTTDQMPGSLQEELVRTSEPFSTTCATCVHLLSIGPDGSPPWFWMVLFIYFISKCLWKENQREKGKKWEQKERGDYMMDGWVYRWVEKTLKIVSTQQIHTASLLYYLFLTPLLIFSKYFYGSR